MSLTDRFLGPFMVQPLVVTFWVLVRGALIKPILSSAYSQDLKWYEQGRVAPLAFTRHRSSVFLEVVCPVQRLTRSLP